MAALVRETNLVGTPGTGTGPAGMGRGTRAATAFEPPLPSIGTNEAEETSRTSSQRMTAGKGHGTPAMPNANSSMLARCSMAARVMWLTPSLLRHAHAIKRPRKMRRLSPTFSHRPNNESVTCVLKHTLQTLWQSLHHSPRASG